MMKILVLNAGSSSQKSCLYDLATDSNTPLWEAKIDWTHQAHVAEIEIKTHNGDTHQETLTSTDRSTAIAHLLETLHKGKTKVIDRLEDIEAVGHRIVHGGSKYQASVLMDDEVKRTIDQLSVFAPSHNPANLEGILAIEKTLGNIPQVAVFDTAFHSHLPEASAVYPVPYEWFESGIRRYGFHGISHEYCANRAAQLMNRSIDDLRLVTCHLGNGCSLAAIQNGRSIDTTMGFTPLEGLMMGSRSGSIDPGIVIHLLRQGKYTVEELDHVLNKECGLKGVSGVSSDLRQVLAKIEAGDRRAKLAYDIYIHRLRSAIGSMIAVLQGVDALVFTGGVGENSANVRADVCQAFGFLGLEIDQQKNRSKPKDSPIAAPTSSVEILVIQTQEDWMIAKETDRVLSNAG